MSLPSPELIDALRAALDANAVLVGDEATAFLIDPRNKPTADDAVVIRPADARGVAATVALCAEHGVAVVPQGGNSGLSYGTHSPTDRPSIVLSVARLNEIISIDPDRWTITAQAGVTIEAIQHAAHAAGRKFAPDWSPAAPRPSAARSPPTRAATTSFVTATCATTSWVSRRCSPTARCGTAGGRW